MNSRVVRRRRRFVPVRLRQLHQLSPHRIGGALVNPRKSNN